MGKKPNIFHKEAGILEKVKSEIADGGQTKKEIESSYKDLSTHYEKLLRDTKVLTSVSDRLHHKVDDANKQLKVKSEEIKAINNELKMNNEVLQDTVDMLVEARVSQKASSMVLLIAVLLFIASEVFIEPVIEENTSSEYVGLLLKGIIALLLKPIDILMERLLMKQAIKDANERTWNRLKKHT